MSTIDWEFTNPERDVEFADIGPDEMRFIIDVWHSTELDDTACSVVVWRDQAHVGSNLILDRNFDSVAEAKEWVEARFGRRDGRTA